MSVQRILEVIRMSALPRPGALVAVLMSLLVLAACSGGGGGGAGGATPSPTPAVISVTPAGGAFVVRGGAADGSTLTFPSGAVATPVDVEASDGSAIGFAGSLGVGPALHLGPTGLQFAAPVAVGVRFSPASLPSGRVPAHVVVLRREDAGGAVAVLTPVSIDVVGGVVVVETDTFSTFQAHVGGAPDGASSTLDVAPRSGVVADGVDAAVASVVVRDVYGLPYPGAAVSVVATGPGSMVTAPIPTSAMDGRYSASLRSTRAGAKVVTASVAGASGAISLGAPVTVTFVAGLAVTLAFTTQPSDVDAGSAVAPAIEVGAADANGNAAALVTPVALALASGPAGAMLSGTVVAAPSGGRASFANVRLDRAGSGYTLSASASGLQDATSAAFAVAPAAPARLRFRVQPASTDLLAPVAPAVEVEVTDDAGNPTTASGIPVTVALAQPQPVPAALSGTVTIATALGVARFADLRIDAVAQGFALAASAPGLVPTASAAFGVGAGSGVRLTFAVEPSAATAGAAIAPPVRVAVVDAAGVTVPARVAVTLSIASGPPGATILGAGPVTTIAGVSEFPAIILDQAAAGYSLEARSPGLPAATSRAFAVTTSASSILAFVAPVQDVDLNDFLTPAVRVRVLDGRGAPILSGAPPITLALVPPAGIAATLAGTATAAPLDGVAVFTDLSVDRIASGYRFTASAPGAGTITSEPFSVRSQGVNAGRPYLAAGRTYGMTGRIDNWTLGDVDGDGAEDAVAAINQAGRIAIIYGRGDGSFEPNTTLSMPQFRQAGDVQVADMIGDARAEVVVGYTDSGIGIYGTTAALPRGLSLITATASLGLVSRSMKVGDVDGDGLADVVTSHSGTTQVLVRTQDPARRGTFLAPVSITVGANPQEVVLADLDGDGRLDIGASCIDDGAVWVALADPARPGAFHVSARYPVAGGPFFLTSGDLDGDGRPDLVAGKLNQGAASVSVLYQSASQAGMFDPSIELATPFGAYGTAIGDVDGDGLRDLVVMEAAAHEGLVFPRASSTPRGFLQPGRWRCPTFPARPALADLDRDGRLDLLVGHISGSGSGGEPPIHVYPGDPSRPAGRALAQALPCGVNPSRVLAADVDGDGAPDLVASDRGNGALIVIRQDPASPGTFLAPVSYATGTTPQLDAVADVDGDGLLDLVSTSFNGSSLLVTRQDPSAPGTFLATTLFAAGSFVRESVVVDLDGDGRLDVVVANNSHQFSVLMQDPSAPGTFLPPATYPAGFFSPENIGAGDLDRDGFPDIVLAGQFTYAFLQDPDHPGTFRPGTNLAFNGGALLVRDVDGDGSLDIVQSGFSDSRLIRGRGDGTFFPEQSLATAGQRAAAGDVDGDGVLDLVFARRGGASNFDPSDRGDLPMLLGDPTTGGFARGPVFLAGSSPEDVAVADLDGDGLAEVVSADSVNVANVAGTLSVLWSLPPRSRPPSGAVALSFLDPVQGTAATEEIPPVRIAVVDASGRPVADGVVAVTVRVVGPSGVVLAGPLLLRTQGGAATVSGLRVARPGAGYVMSATAVGLTAAASAPFTTAPLTVPGAPAFSIVAVSATSVEVAWSPTGAAATVFEVERAPTSGGPFARVARRGAPSRGFVDIAVLPQASYVYRVRAFNPAGASAYSTEASVTLPARIPPAGPPFVYATGGAGAAKIGWPKVATALSYNVYVGDAPGGAQPGGAGAAYRSVTSVASPFLVDDLAAGATWYVGVSFVDRYGESLASEVAVTASAAAPVTRPALHEVASGFSQAVDLVVDELQRRAWVLDAGRSEIVAVDLTTETVTARIPVAVGARGLSLSPDGRWLVAACAPTGFSANKAVEIGELSVVSPEAQTLTARFVVAADPFDIEVMDTGYMYISPGSNQHSAVRVYDPSGAERGAWYAIMGQPMSSAPDGSAIYIVNFNWNVSEYVVGAQPYELEALNGTGTSGGASPPGVSADARYVVATGGEQRRVNGLAFVRAFSEGPGFPVAAADPRYMWGLRGSSGELLRLDLDAGGVDVFAGYSSANSGSPRVARLGPRGLSVFVLTQTNRLVCVPTP